MLPDCGYFSEWNLPQAAIPSSQPNPYINSPFYLVRTLGNVGDGGAGNTLAIQRAIDSAYAAGSGVVFILPPTPWDKVRLSSPLIPRRGVSIRGVYPGATPATNSWDLGFEVDTGTVLTYPGGTVFQQDMSGGLGTLSSLNGVVIESLGFDNVGGIISCGTFNTSGLEGSVIRDILASNVTGIAFDITNPLQDHFKNIRACCAQLFRIKADYDATIGHAPGNSHFIDCYAYILAGGHNLPSVHLRAETRAGFTNFLNFLHFSRLQINRMTSAADADSAHIFLDGSAAGRINGCTFDGLDLEGYAEYIVKGNYVLKSKFYFVETHGTNLGCQAALHLRNSDQVLLDVASYYFTVDVDDTVTNCFATGKIEGVVGGGKYPLGTYVDYSVNPIVAKTHLTNSLPDRDFSYSNAGGAGARFTYTNPPETGKVFVSYSGVYLNNPIFPTSLVDGITSGAEVYPADNAPVLGSYLKFTFPNKVLIDEVTFYSTPGVNAQGVAQFAISEEDDATLTNVGNTFNFGGQGPVQTITTLSGNTLRFKALYLLGVSGNTNWNDYYNEFEFKIKNMI